MAESRLFKSLQVGNVEVKHRIGMAPLTRLRASSDRVPVPLMKDYYGQRASVPGTLIISEGTFISPSACGGFANAPGIWSQDQVTSWRTITDEVHRKGCFIFCQLFAMGRAADVEVATREGLSVVGPSAIPTEEGAPIPRPMTIDEIKQTVKDFMTASKNAISAGFDGVECHGGNGFLADQFIQDVSNQRDDDYGGTVENRSRLINDIMKAVVSALGPDRVGLRLSPWSVYQVESRIAGADDYNGNEQLDFAYKLWHGPLLVAGGYNLANAQKLVNEEYPDKDIVVMFGRHFVSNPDLVYRIKEGLALSAYERNTFYLNSPLGYVDYPFSVEYLASENID
ncbi:hypothetical protein BP5796_02892 [Coleophoma crateriformis]|uniref:NADH:flavin oxidoreductase/NADH oxidase N-terminal domain-containing protein n=1 Tax=Coleophoma crateriformis TaxID=565419 RepID=A0A3D8SZH8_9HELO|nr:hypothetical protein BP5796_02892 [Coleophoma crateriformis]